MNRIDTLAVRTLLTMGRQRLGLEEPRGRAVFELAASGAAVCAALQGALLRHHLSKLQFDVLLVLFALEPRLVAPADLSHYTGFTRSSVSGAITDLRARGHLVSFRLHEDRRQLEVSLTATGRTVIDAAVADYLQVLATLADQVPFSPVPALHLVDSE